MVKNKGRKLAKRPVNRRLSLLERGTAVGLSKAGHNAYSIADELNCTPKTVRELLKKVETEKKLEDRDRSGRPKLTTPREDRGMKFKSLKDRRLTAKAMALKTLPNLTKNKVSVTTVKDRLKKVGLNGRVARKKPLLSEANRKARLQWAKEHRHWSADDWRNVIFSDESPFTLFQTSGKQYVRRRPGEEWKDECLFPTVKHGGGKIQVWGCFSWNGGGPMYRVKDKLTGAQYRQVLKTHMAPYLRQFEIDNKCEAIFQHDNDPKHTSKVVQAYLKNKAIVVLDWPSQSPDMNPIEHSWKAVKDRIFSRVDHATNLNEVFEIAKEEWKKLDVSYFQKLIKSMPRRVEAVYQARGRHTKY
jgi:DNA-binding CsgD family transcriptional regulator